MRISNWNVIYQTLRFEVRKGTRSYSIFSLKTGELIEGGFFTNTAAITAADRWERNGSHKLY